MKIQIPSRLQSSLYLSSLQHYLLIFYFFFSNLHVFLIIHLFFLLITIFTTSFSLPPLSSSLSIIISSIPSLSYFNLSSIFLITHFFTIYYLLHSPFHILSSPLSLNLLLYSILPFTNNILLFTFPSFLITLT